MITLLTILLLLFVSMISKELFEVFTSIKESLTTDIVETFAGKKTSAKKIILHSLNFVQINQ